MARQTPEPTHSRSLVEHQCIAVSLMQDIGQLPSWCPCSKATNAIPLLLLVWHLDTANGAHAVAHFRWLVVVGGGGIGEARLFA